VDPVEQAVVFVHIVAAVVWIGGMVFLAAVGPALRKLYEPSSAPLFRAMALRFRDISWVAVVALIGTGIANLALLGAFRDLRGFFAANPLLAGKIAVVALMVAVKGVHDFIVGPRASLARDANPVTASRLPVWRAAMALGRLNLALGLFVLYLSVGIAHAGGT